MPTAGRSSPSARTLWSIWSSCLAATSCTFPAPVGQLDAALPTEARAELLAELLAANLLGRDTGGATLALDTLLDEVVLCRGLPSDGLTLERAEAGAGGLPRPPLGLEAAPRRGRCRSAGRTCGRLRLTLTGGSSVTDSIGGGGFRIARQPAHQTESTRVKPGSPRPQAEAGLNRFGEVGIRTGARVTRARTGGVEVKRFFTKLSLPFRSAAYKTERSLRHAEHRFDRHVNRMVEDLANKGAKLSDRALLGRLGAIAREAGRVTGLATAKGELSNPAAMRARFDTNLREALAGLGKKAPDKLAAVQARLGKLSDAQLGQVVSRAVGGMGTAEALRWGVVRGQHLTGPTPQMQTAQSLLGSLRNALNEAGGPGSARSTIDVDDDMSSDEVQETPVYKPSGAKDGPGMLAWLSGAYGGTDEDSMSGWRDPHIGVSVEALVRERVEEQGVSVHVAVKDLNDAIKADKGLQPAFASKLLALTAALREETILAGKLDQHDALSGIAEKDLWRLVAPAKGQADDDKWLADSVNQGSLAGMLRGFGHMIEAQEQGEPITAELPGRAARRYDRRYLQDRSRPR